MKKPVTVVLIVVGVLFLGMALFYWATPAGSLPHWFPGYLAHATEKHFKHGLAALILALGSWALAWFSLGKKDTGPTASEPKV